MKKLALIAAAVVATSAFAGGPGHGHPPAPAPAPAADYPVIDAQSVQATVLVHTGVVNAAAGGSTAQQNLATNAGAISVGAEQY